MKAIVYNRKCGPDRLVYCDIAKPVPNDSQVLIKISSVSLNAADYRAMQLGLIPKSRIFGSDIAGIIESVGKNCSEFKPGDEVIGCLVSFGHGGLAEYVAVSEKALVIKPKQISFEDASTLPIAGITALQGLRNKGNIKKGNKVLIVGSSGGVGIFAVQLAKYFQAEVTGVCSTRNVKQSFAIGADHVIDYSKDHFLKLTMRYDIILGINGNYSLLSYHKALTKNGAYIMVGGSFSQIFKSIIFGWVLSFGTKKMKFVVATELNTDLKFLADLVENGFIKPVIERRYTLDKAVDAMNYVRNGHASGKIVINIT